MTNRDGEADPPRGGDVRRRLIEAGHLILGQRGMDAVTVKEISRTAGASPGLFHYYFDSKDELLLAVVQEAGEDLKRRLMSGVAPTGSPSEHIDGAVGFIEGVAGSEPELFRVRYELYALALRHPVFRDDVGAQLGHIRAAIAHTLGRWAPDRDPRSVEALSAVVLACFDGLALQQIAQPDVDLHAAYELLGALMHTELAPAVEPPDERNR